MPWAFTTELLTLYFLLKPVDLERNFMIDRFTETLEIGVFELMEIVLDNLGLGETTYKQCRCWLIKGPLPHLFFN